MSRPRVAVALTALALLAPLAACGPRAGGPTTSPPAGPSTRAERSAATGFGATGGSAGAARPARYVFPVAGAARYARVHHDYPATDIMASCGTPVRAVTAGTVLEVNRVDRWNPQRNDGATRGGLAVSVLGDDGVRYYGSHFSRIDPALAAGRRVNAGQVLGQVGETGDASACHLHFGISPPCRRHDDWWIRRGVLWPWPFLDSWRSGGQASPVSQVAAWRAAHGCPATPPPGA